MPPEPPRILVVDDHEDLHQLAGWIFRERGWNLAIASDGFEALQLVAEFTPDIILLDLILPHLDGWDVLQAVRGMPEPPPVIVLSVCGDRDSFARGARGGAAAYLFKPFRVEDLVATSERLLGLHREAGVGSDRRAEPRRVFACDLTARLRNTEPFRWAKLVDLSPRGAMLDLDEPVAPGQTVQFSVRTLDGHLPLDAEGLVRWSRPGPRGYAHGVEFDIAALGGCSQVRDLLGLAG